MQVTFYPKRLIFTAAAALVVWIVFAATNMTRAGTGLIAVTAIVAGVAFDLFFSVNPAFWGPKRRRR